MNLSFLRYFPNADHERITRLLRQKRRWFMQEKKGFLRYRLPMEQVQDLQTSHCDFSGEVVRIGTADELNRRQRAKVQELLQALMPWRKGPFAIFGTLVDAEWRSNLKWDRLLPELPDLKDKIVGDIGCNNGYYMFRMAPFHPAYVLGLDPHVQHYFTFQALNGFAGYSRLGVELLGIEHLHLFPDSFDVLFCLGVIYHRPSPIDSLQALYTALKPGGTLLLESQAIPGDQPMALFPEQTYAKVPGTWFVPTTSCLANWLTRTGFAEVRCFCSHPMSPAEQRRTEWMVFESYEDFIDKNNPLLTIEGYPAPLRVFFKATR
ncbi:MAG: tRNA 5-methoxyuridine(34)/uridine 5-oxyacetic acid(34) synthase CmoB [Desulfobulbus propionicus]|nr:MAG: tRNA 5-methoxyuridine(34)/uridine 5-oxyacetic acid(34) synthase CmoB [Desulfobulbus propionicus]